MSDKSEEVKRKLLGLGVCHTCNKEKPLKEITPRGESAHLFESSRPCDESLKHSCLKPRIY